MAVNLSGQLEGLGQTICVGQRGGSVGGFSPVVGRLRPIRVTGEPVLLTQRVEKVPATRQDLVHIRLVAGVENQRVRRRVEYPVHGDRQLYNAQVRSQVAAGCGDLLDKKLADLRGQLL